MNNAAYCNEQIIASLSLEDLEFELGAGKELIGYSPVIVCCRYVC